jgi:hypothetical protein
VKTYKVYLGSSEQYVYTWRAQNIVELRKMIVNQWPLSYTGRWFKKDTVGCPKGSKRWYVKNMLSKPVLVMPG